MSHFTSSSLLTSSLFSHSYQQSSITAGLSSSSDDRKKTLSDDEKLKLLKQELKEAKREQKVKKIAWKEDGLTLKTKPLTSAKVVNPLLSSNLLQTNLYNTSLQSSLTKKTGDGIKKRSKSPAARKDTVIKNQLGVSGIQSEKLKLGTSNRLLSAPSSLNTNIKSRALSTTPVGTSSTSSVLKTETPTLSGLSLSVNKTRVGTSSATTALSTGNLGLKLNLNLGSKLESKSGLTPSSLLSGGKSKLSTDVSRKADSSGLSGSHIGTLTLSTKTSLTLHKGRSEKKQNNVTLQENVKLSKKKITTKVKATTKVKVYKSDIDEPVYTFTGSEDVVEVEIPSFVPPEKDMEIVKLQTPVHDIEAIKSGLINAVSASLIRAPDFKESKDPFRIELLSVVERVALYDGEFILKLALYTRNELNIRTTANFLLACASNIRGCRPYLRKYYNTSIRLPSDWIDVAEQYQAFHDKNLHFGSLPAALRRVMVQKFPNFDKYQLGKYNKENSAKKKRKKAKKEAEGVGVGGRGRGRGRGGRGRGFGGRGRGAGRGRGGYGGGQRNLLSSDSESSDSNESDSDDEEKEGRKKVNRQISAMSEQSETEEELARLSFTLKQLIRKLHITEPVEHVMCLIGKKYPSTLEDFYRSRLPDTFDEERAGKRMKLPTPETWETQVSMKGNKASTWESLIDHKKLPFMAMLRNLRNMIKAGISEKHHKWVIKKLTDEGAVTNSRQFPFRFFSAYEVLTQLEADFNKNQNQIIAAAIQISENPEVRGGRNRVRGGRGRGGRGRGGGRGGKSGGSELPDEVPYDVALLKRYRKALDEAVKIATLHNVKPIRGNTIIFVNAGREMSKPCTSARGLGAPRTVLDVGVLLGLMCKFSCEASKMIIYGNKSHAEVELEKGTILDNMQSVLSLREIVDDVLMGQATAAIPDSYMTDLLKNRIQIDNLIVLSQGMQKSSADGRMIADFLCKYRRIVNRNLLYVSVDLSGKSAGIDSSIQPAHDNDIHIAGYSDQILRFIAERGDSGQLIHVENIDKAYSLDKVASVALEKPTKNEPVKAAPEKPLPVVSFTPRWQTARVFISSTFRDMHGERDLLTRFVFPELRARAAKMFINVFEVDLRWGVTEEMSRTNQTIELCLTEVDKCQFFVGLLGERYGWVPQQNQFPDAPQFDWIKDYHQDVSVTELEMHSGALSQPSNRQSSAFFYLRDPTFMEDIPKQVKNDFMAEDGHAEKSMEKLKRRIRQSGLEVYDDYPCKWAGVHQGKPLVTGLEHLGERVLNNLWIAIQNHYNQKDSVLDEWTHTEEQHRAYIESHQDTFVGRKQLINSCIQIVKDNNQAGRLVAVVGKPGSGKTAVLASFVKEFVSKNPGSGLSILTHFIGAAPGSTNITAMLRRLNHELCRRFSLNHKVAEEYKNLVPQFEELLKESGKEMQVYPLVVVIDGMDLMEEVHQAQNMQWLPDNIPQNVIIIASVQDGGICHRALMKQKPLVLEVGILDMWDKAEVVRTTLAQHRKKLDESPFNNQMKLLTAKKEAINPFYLKLACEEMRVYGLFEKINNKLKSLPHTIPQLLQEILTRLEYDHGLSLVSAALCLLACSRSGLHEEDLHQLLSYYQIFGWQNRLSVDVIRNADLGPSQMIPKATFVQLVRALQGFLMPNSGQESSMLVLSHKEVTSAVIKRYLKSIDEEKCVHLLIATHYWICADPESNAKWMGKYKAAFQHLPYHLACGGCYDQLESVLCNLYFLQTKCIMGMSHDLAEDFLARGLSNNKTAERESQRFQKKVDIQTFQKFITSNLHVLATHPGLLWQQALNEPDGSLPQVAVSKLLKEEESVSMIGVLNKPKRSNPCIYTISDMPQLVTCLAISSYNKILAAGSRDCMVHIYDLDTGKETLTLVGHSDQVTSVCFVGTDKLCSASADTTLCLWDLIHGHRLAVMKGHTRHVGSCSANSKAEYIVSAGWDRKLKVWKGRDGRFAYDLKGDHGPMNCVAWHPDDSLIAIGSWDSAIRIWDVFNKVRKAVLRGHSSSVRDLCYSPSGRHIASAAIDGEVKLWSASHGSQVGTLSGHALPINRLTFSPQGHELITVSDDHKVKVWSGHLGQLIGEMGQEEDGAVVSISLHPDGDLVAVGYHEGNVRVYDILSGLVEYEDHLHNASVRALTYEKEIAAYAEMKEEEGYRLFTGSDDCTMKMLSSDMQVIVGFQGHTKGILSITVANQIIVSTSEDITTCVYKLPDSYKPDTVLKPYKVLTGHEGPVTSSAINPTITRLVTASRDMSLMFWDLDNLDQPLHVIKGAHMDWINGCSWSDANDFLVTCSNDFTLKLWDTKNYKEKIHMTGHMSAVNSVAYSCGCIVSCSCEGVVKVWSHKGTEMTSLHGHKQRVNACDIRVKYTRKQAIQAPEKESTDWATMTEEMDWAAKHDKTKLDKREIKIEDVFVASCSDDGTVRVWRPLEGNEICCLTGHSDRVTCVTASQNQICTGALDHTLKLWKPEHETDEIEVKGHKGEISALASIENGEILLTASRDGMVKYWMPTLFDPVTKPQYTFQAHRAAVTGICFMKGFLPVERCFATCSEDSTIKMWKVVMRRNSLSVKLFKTINLGSPLTGMHYYVYTHIKNKVESIKALITTDWRGIVTVIDTKDGRIMNKTRQDRDFQWILCSALSGFDLFYGGTGKEQQPMKISVAEFFQGKVTNNPSPKYLEPIQYKGDEHLSPYKRQVNWLTAVASINSGYMVYYGDVNGQLSLIIAGNVKKTRQVHSGSITSIAISDNYVFSASKDGTLKVWDTDLDKQLGQYFAPSPITKLSITSDDDCNPNCVAILCGDLLGDITLLAWRGCNIVPQMMFGS